jgi:hypothetical protein
LDPWAVLESRNESGIPWIGERKQFLNLVAQKHGAPWRRQLTFQNQRKFNDMEFFVGYSKNRIA